MGIIKYLLICILLNNILYSSYRENVISLKDLDKYDIYKALEIDKLILLGEDKEFFRIPKTLENFKNVNELIITNTKLEVCEELFTLPNLETLTIVNSIIINEQLFESKISELKKLKTLETKNQQLGIKNLSNMSIETLVFSNVEFQKDCLIELNYLELIIVDSTNIDSITFSVTGIDYFYLTDVEFKEKDKLFLNNKTEIKSLVFSFIEQENQLKFLIDYIKPEYNIQSFEVSNSNIIKLPENIFKNMNLKYIGLFETGIEYIPDGIQELVSLNMLSINPKLKELPLFLNNLETLEKVFIPNKLYLKINESNYNFKIQFIEND